LIIQPAAVIYRLIEPELALAFGGHNFSLFQRIFARSSQLSLWGGLGTCLLIGVSTHWIFPIWTSGKISMNWVIYIILLVGVMVRCFWGSAIVALYATNRHASVAALYFSIYGVFAFCLGYFGAKNFGLDGVVLALLLTEAVMAFIIIRASLRLSCMELGKWTRILLHPPIDIISRVTLAFLKRGKAFTQ